jgi:glutamine synthetase adenylyltransferase
MYATGILDAEDAELLREAYRTLRQLLHRLTLEGKPEHYPEQALSETFRQLRQGVVRMWHERMDEH